MKPLLVIVPSRGRPSNAAELVAAWQATSDGIADLLFGLDVDDPTLVDYLAVDAPRKIGARKGMCGTLNDLAAARCHEYRHLGFMGDDHRPRTPGWDTRIVAALDDLGTGIVYGDDLFQRENLPTAVFLSSTIVQRLGYMAPAELLHLYMDNFWLDLGRGLGALRYLPDVVIEHVHPSAGKGAWDEGYERVNSGAMYEHDRQVYEAYRADRLHADVERVRA